VNDRAIRWGLALSFLVSGETIVSADSTENSRVVGRFGIVALGRVNQGELGTRYRSGVQFGIHTGVDVRLGESAWSVGIGWTTLVYGFYMASDSSLVDQQVRVTEADLGLRIRRRLSFEPRFITATAGGIYSTSSVPLPPQDKRRYLGYYGGLGYEYAVVGNWLLGGEMRYARFPDGPENLSFFVSFTAGI